MKFTLGGHALSFWFTTVTFDRKEDLLGAIRRDAPDSKNAGLAELMLFDDPGTDKIDGSEQVVLQVGVVGFHPNDLPARWISANNLIPIPARALLALGAGSDLPKLFDHAGGDLVIQSTEVRYTRGHEAEPLVLDYIYRKDGKRELFVQSAPDNRDVLENRAYFNQTPRLRLGLGDKISYRKYESWRLIAFTVAVGGPGDVMYANAPAGKRIHLYAPGVYDEPLEMEAVPSAEPHKFRRITNSISFETAVILQNCANGIWAVAPA